jgi:polysaccharide export outer membrane protein
MHYRHLYFLFLGYLIIGMSSCISSKKVVYLNNLSDTTTAILGNAKTLFETPIQKNDLLSIVVGGSNPEDLIMLNSGSGIIPGATSGGDVISKTIGYLVEADGKIQFPFLGKVQAEGLTRIQLEAQLTDKLKDYTKNPVVNIRFLNYNIAVLGEVKNPGRFNVPTERTTILDAISLAGDLNAFGKRDNVLVIREVNGQREFGRINLLSKDIFNSPYFYLKTNDVVYVEPVKSSFITRTGVPQYVGIAAVGISLLITIINLTK